jgi:hypothetical protein
MKHRILFLIQYRLALDLNKGVKTNYPKFTGAVQAVIGFIKKEYWIRH